MNRAEKELMIAEIEEKFKTAASAVLTDYRGLNVQDMAELRSGLKKEGVEYKVYKNTLTRRAADQAKIQGLDEHLDGPTGLAFGFDDPLAAARALTAYAKTNRALKIKGGLLEGKVIGGAEIRLMASLPTKDVLIAQLASALNAPIVKLVSTLNEPIRRLAATLGIVVGQKPGPKAEAKPEQEPEPEAKVEQEPEAKVEQESEPKVESKPEQEPEPEPEAKVEPEPEPKVEQESEPKVEAKTEPESEAKQEPEPKAETEPEEK